MDEDKIQELKRQKLYAKIQIASVYPEYQKSLKTTNELKEKLDRWKDIYERSDSQLAEIDGRLTVVTTPTRKPKKVEPATLTIEQIKDIAEKVGIKIDLGEECNFD